MTIFTHGEGLVSKIFRIFQANFGTITQISNRLKIQKVTNDG